MRYQTVAGAVHDLEQVMDRLALTTADAIELFTRRLERVSAQFPDVVESLAAGLGPAEAILEGRPAPTMRRRES
jgi:hypothetical protein